MVDRLFSEPALARLYDGWHPWESRADFGFYLPLLMAARRVLDVGCGTGELLRLARERGHTGRLCGLDPAAAMLDQARARADIEWYLGDLGSVTWDGDFDLVVMTGHAFQVLVDDDDLRVALAAIRSALDGDGRFVFETRNPAARGWEEWAPANALDVTGPNGEVVHAAHQVVTPFDGDVVTFTITFTSAGWARPEVSHSTLRFLDAPTLARFLAAAGLAIESQFGDFDRRPLAATSAEIVTVARRA
jgi:SAM-dependent methyltransferase